MLLLSLNAFSQQHDIRGILKINATSLPLKNLSLQYEYFLSKKVSLAIGAHAMPTLAIPFEGLLVKALTDGGEEAKNIINLSRLGNLAFTPEMRYYFGRGFGKGFYAAPYYRFANFTSHTLIVNYAAPGGVKRSVTLGGEMNTHAAGLLLGAQWFLSEHITLDWWIAGAHYGTSRGNFTGVPSTSFSKAEQAEVKRVIDELDIPMVTKNVTVSDDEVRVKTNGPFGGVRPGVCLGVRF